MRLCIPVTARSNGEALRKMGRSYRAPGFSEILLELRVDGIANLDLGDLLAGRRGRVIVTNRQAAEGGGFTGTEEERVRILRQAVAHGADFVDIEASTPPDLIASLKEEIGSRGAATRLIVSHHDGTKTPSEETLKKRFAACVGLGAAIVKIVTMARVVEDNLRVLSLVPHARREGVEVVAFCMGAAGRISRLLSPLLGAYLCFASAAAHEASAPGQMTVKEMVKMVRMISAGSSEAPPKTRQAGERLFS